MGDLAILRTSSRRGHTPPGYSCTKCRNRALQALHKQERRAMEVFDWFREWAKRSNRAVATPRHPEPHAFGVERLTQGPQLKDEAMRLDFGDTPAAVFRALSSPEFATFQKVGPHCQGDDSHAALNSRRRSSSSSVTAALAKQ